jgi:pSer/pThr/pTyr-binding forkhead associated (FHA) protein
MIITIGRKETNDIVIENRTVSSNHAALSFEGGLFYITDNNSTNGTFINDMRFTKGKICPDDIVRIGAVFAKINY